MGDCYIFLAVSVLYITRFMEGVTQARKSASFLQKNAEIQHSQGGNQQWKRTSKIKTSPSATFGKSGRNSEEKKVVPGPGSYELDRSSLQKGVITFKGNKNIRIHTDSPGPCAYKPKDLFTSKKYSFEKSEAHSKEEISPSPVTYHLHDLQKPHAAMFCKQQRQLIVEKGKQLIPGPGKYDSYEEDLSNKKYSFTKTRKFTDEEPNKEKQPGPGTYEIAHSRNKIKSGKFTKALRNFINSDKIPGPGTYQVDKSMLSHEGGTIVQEKRSFNYENGNPGPGKYEDVSVDITKKREGFTVMNRSKEVSPDQKIPGPGSYFKENVSSASKILGGVITREKKLKERMIEVPGPLSYKPRFEEIISKTASVVIGKEKRIKDVSVFTPGPGSYSIDKKARDSHSRSLFADFNRLNITMHTSKRDNSRHQPNKSAIDH